MWARVHLDLWYLAQAMLRPASAGPWRWVRCYVLTCLPQPRRDITPRPSAGAPALHLSVCASDWGLLPGPAALPSLAHWPWHLVVRWR